MSYIKCLYVEVQDDLDSQYLELRLAEGNYPFYDATAFDSCTNHEAAAKGFKTLEDIEGYLELK
jgi:hypothetical protein